MTKQDVQDKTRLITRTLAGVWTVHVTELNAGAVDAVWTNGPWSIRCAIFNPNIYHVTLTLDAGMFCTVSSENLYVSSIECRANMARRIKLYKEMLDMVPRTW